MNNFFSDLKVIELAGVLAGPSVGLFFAELGAKVIKIDVDKNKELAEALRIKGLPTFMIYKDGQMVWRQSGEFDANTLISLIQEQA